MLHSMNSQHALNEAFNTDLAQYIGIPSIELFFILALPQFYHCAHL